MRLLEWFRFGKRITKLDKDIDELKRDNKLHRERIERLIEQCDKLGEIEHIAAEMVEALDAASKVLDAVRIDDAPVAGKGLRDQAQLAFVQVIMAQHRWQEWRERQLWQT